MKHRPAIAKKQSGVALILFLIALILAGSYAFYRSNNIDAKRNERDAIVISTLAKAKEALIAYAIIDSKRPGRLLCPDLIHNGVSPILSRDDCDAYIGWLPWKTLDLRDATDDHGTELRYVALRWFGGDRAKPPLNSDTLNLNQLTDAGILPPSLEGTALGTLYLDIPVGSGTNTSDPNNLRNDIVALIIAPRGDLDPRNADGDNYFFSGKSSSDADNDLIMPVTRQELMAAVEKRVANELKTCLEQHAAATNNTEHTYPWPAPLDNNTFRGTAGSLFGQVPATEPGPGAESLLQQANSTLSNAKNALSSASTATDQMAALLIVNTAASYAQTLYDKIYAVAKALASVASTSQKAFAGLTNNITTATANGRISRTERTTLRAEALSDKDYLTTLKTAIVDSGIDPYPNEVKTQDLILQQAINTATSAPTALNFTTLQTQADVLVKLFGLSSTRNPDITTALNNARNAASATVAAAASAAALPTDATRLTTAYTAAQSLVTADRNLRNTIAASRINLHYSEFSTRADQLATLLGAFTSNPGATTASALATGLTDLQSTANTLSTASSLVIAARGEMLNTVANALSAAQAASDYSHIQTTSSATIDAANNLSNAIANNGDNVVKESLVVAAAAYVSAQEIFATITTRNQATMVPYVQAMQSPAVNIEYWSEIIARVATDIASLARKAPNAASDNSTSAYAIADQLTSGIAGSSGTQALLQAYIDTPTSSSKQVAATEALNATANQLDALLSSANTLDTALDSGSAEAFPTIWYGSACAFLQPASGSSSWWTANSWANTTFYQISDRIRATAGKLQVNGSGTYRVVTISAGKSLGIQTRSTRTTANFLEGANADTSRDGNAKAPVTVFVNAPVSSTFNDRLAY